MMATGSTPDRSKSSSKDSLMEQIGILLIIAIAVAVPLVFSGFFHLSFELPKMAIFRILTSLLAIIFILKVGNEGALRLPSHPLRNGVIIGLILIAFSQTISILFSTSPFLSIFGSYERIQGAISFLHYGIFFAAVAILANGIKNRKKI